MINRDCFVSACHDLFTNVYNSIVLLINIVEHTAFNFDVVFSALDSVDTINCVISAKVALDPEKPLRLV